eukprot:gene8101-10972_t
MIPFVAGFAVAILACVVYLVVQNRSFDKNAKNSSLISPTAHYTGYIWFRNGLSDPRLETKLGPVLYHSLEPLMQIRKYFKVGTLEETLLTRHQLLDFKLDDAIKSGKVTQIIEVAAGLSSRGLRFAKKYGNKIKYIEADLPDMVALKKSLIEYPVDNNHHNIVVINALQTEDSEPDSILFIAQNNGLSMSEGTVIITEGLVNYFNKDDLLLMWSKFASALALFPRGMYISDIHVNNGQTAGIGTQLFKFILSRFVGRKVHLHFTFTSEAEAALSACGFNNSAKIQEPSTWAKTLEYCNTAGSRRVSIIDAKTNW